MKTIINVAASTCFKCKRSVWLNAQFTDDGQFLTLYCSECLREVEEVESKTIEEMERIFKNRRKEDESIKQ